MIVSELKQTAPRQGHTPVPSDRITTAHPERSKRVLDLVLGSILAVLAAPLIVAGLVLVRLTSRGPAIYKQVRLGRNKRHYTIYKIRSMYQDCESKSGPCWATKGDSRVTPVGRVLRSTHIDELPQLWNVLRGEMSLVGPRPERPEIAGNLERVIPHYGDRMLVRPGLTGLAQVQLPPDAGLADVKRKLSCDLHYIEHADVWLDLRILLSTISHVLGIPFEIPRAILRVPSVEAVYRGAPDAARVQVV